MSLKMPAVVRVTLPDETSRHFETPVTAADVARSIGPGLFRQAVAARVDDQLVDLSDPITADARVAIITERDSLGLEVIRHSCAHLLGHALKQLFPGAQMVIGPVIDDGFYYDVAHERPFTLEDRQAIEARMQALMATEYDIIKCMVPRAHAWQIFDERGERYKCRLIEEMSDEVQAVGLYFHEDYVDMCRGPHVPNTRFLRHFTLTKLAGAYWRGDARNEQLQRFYGTAWSSRKDLQAYLKRVEEAEKRDHRRLGRELDLFHFQEEAPGAVFWHPKGWLVFRSLIEYLRRRQDAAGYVEVNTPDAMDRALWETSGHWQNYRDHMFTLETEDGNVQALKPMNCPGSVLLYRHGHKSYRDLPIRMGEFGKVHRYEPSGALHGLLRVRHFTQDDAHVYCTPAQMDDECRRVIELVLDIYRQFGFEDVSLKLSTRPANRMGDDAVWDRLEGALSQSLDMLGLTYTINAGEGAFYGPKLEFVLHDAIGRDWQCGTLQVDMNLPVRFGLTYIDEHGERQPPVMLHRALFGSLERFLGILVEHHAGKLPAWLAPRQVMVLSITDAHADYARDLASVLQGAGLRADHDTRNETIGYRIRQQRHQRVPYLLVVGDREMAERSVALRSRDDGDLGVLTLSRAMAYLCEQTRAPDSLMHQARQDALWERLLHAAPRHAESLDPEAADE